MSAFGGIAEVGLGAVRSAFDPTETSLKTCCGLAPPRTMVSFANFGTMEAPIDLMPGIYETARVYCWAVGCDFRGPFGGSRSAQFAHGLHMVEPAPGARDTYALQGTTCGPRLGGRSKHPIPGSSVGRRYR